MRIVVARSSSTNRARSSTIGPWVALAPMICNGRPARVVRVVGAIQHPSDASSVASR
jgi:hypothetical protein